MSLCNARKLENKLKRQGRGKGFYAMTGIELQIALLDPRFQAVEIPVVVTEVFGSTPLTVPIAALSRQFGYQIRWNQIANLLQNGELAAAWTG